MSKANAAIQSSSSWPPWAEYLLAISVMLAALGVRWLLDPLLGNVAPFITVLATMLLLLLTVRPLPFLVASVFGAIGAVLLFVAPTSTAELLGIVLLGCTIGAAAFAAWLAERIRDRRRHAEQDLARRGEELRVITDTMPALISYIDSELRYRFMNGRYIEWFGQAPEQLVGKTMREVLGDAVFERARPHVEAALAGRRCQYEAEMPYHGGTRFIHAEYMPDVDADGTVAGFYALVTDVSEQRKAETAQARLAAIVETSGDAILSLSPEGHILTWNAGAERLFGHLAKDAIGQSIQLILPPERRDDERSVLERVQRGEIVGPYDTVRRAKDGRHIDVSVTVSPIRDASGRIIGVSKLDRDITERRQAERALRESQRQLATLVSNLPGMAYRYLNQPGWPVELISERVSDIVGYEPQEFISARVSWTQLIHRDDLAKVRAAVDEGVQAGRPYQIEYRVRHRDGSERWVWERGEPVVAAGGEALALEGFVTDITQRKAVEHELEANRARERSYLEQLPVGVWFANDKGDVIYANAAGRRIWGGLRLVGPQDYRTYEAYLFGTDRRIESNQWALARALHGETSIGEELEIRTFDGQRKIILNSAVPVRDGDGTIVGAVLMNLDITEQKQAELALKDADRRKDEFLATLGHELRNPLAAIRTATELLGRPDNREQPDRFAAVIKRQVALMVRLIDDLLDVSRITHGTLELRTDRVSLRSLVEQALDAAQPWIRNKHHHVEIEIPADPLEVQGDAVRLVQVLSNVLNNACKYTDPGGRIELRIAREGESAVVEIRDNGIGIPPDKLDTIFDMFSQLDPPGRGDGGLGIGLTLSRRLVEMHGGSMSASSAGPGCGSVFTIRIPALPVAQPERTGAAAADAHRDTGRDEQGRRVLVVDDNVDAADTLAILLSARGHATRTAYDGTSALAEVAKFRPEVLLLDLGLPDINGAEVCKAVRAQPWGKNMLVVALSGWGQERDKQRTSEAGFDAHLTKPANLGELTSLLANAPAS